MPVPALQLPLRLPGSTGFRVAGAPNEIAEGDRFEGNGTEGCIELAKIEGVVVETRVGQ